MPYKNPIIEKERSLKRREYFRNRYYRLVELGLWKYGEYNKSNKSNKYISHGKSIGYIGEEIALKKLSGSIRIIRPSDLSWMGKKVEVKTAIKQNLPRSKTYRWKFLLTQLRKVDLFFLICEDKNKIVQYIYLIPDNNISVKNFTISESKINKYSRFLLTL